MPHGDGRPDVVNDRLVLELVRTGGALGDDDQLLGGVVGVVREADVRTVEHFFGQLVGRHGERGDEAGAQRPAGFLCRELEVLRVVVAAVDDDQVFDPAGDVEATVVIGAVVTGTYPQPVIRGAVGV